MHFWRLHACAPFALLLHIVPVCAAGSEDKFIAPAVQLAFGVMTYQKGGRTVEETFQDFKRLMNVIYESQEKHLYVLHVDIKSDEALLGAIHEGFCAPKSNCDYIAPRNIAWAGLTTGEMMLALMHRALEFNKDCEHTVAARQSRTAWDYFVLVGHESVPLYPLPYIEAYLAHAPPGTNFINCWKVQGYDFFGQWEDNTYRLEDMVVDSFDGQLIEDVAPWQRRVPEDIRFYKSIQLVVMSSAFCRFACYGQTTRRILLYLANVKTSDEMLLPTILQSSPDLAATATCDTTLHLTHWIRPGGSWHPEYLTLEHLPLLLNTTKHLFARKFVLPLSAVLLEALDMFRSSLFASRYDQQGPVSILQRASECSGIFSTWLPPTVRKHMLAVLGSVDDDESLKVIASRGFLAMEAAISRDDSDVDKVTMAAMGYLDEMRAQRDAVETKKFFEMIAQRHSEQSMNG